MPEDFSEPVSAQACAALSALLAQRDQAFRRTVHDLRGPLTALQLAAETLAEIGPADGAEAAGIAAQIEADVRRLADLLAARARCDAQGAQIDLRTFLSGDVAALAQPLAIRRAQLRITGAAFGRDCGPPLSPAVALALLQTFCHAAVMVPASGALMIGADRQDGRSMVDIRICDAHGARAAGNDLDALRGALALLVDAGDGRISTDVHADGGGWRISLADRTAPGVRGGAP